MAYSNDRKYQLYQGKYYYLAANKPDGSLLLCEVDWTPDSRPLKEQLTDRISELAVALDNRKGFLDYSTKEYESFDPSIKTDPILGTFAAVTTVIPLTKPVGFLSSLFVKIDAWLQSKRLAQKYLSILEDIEVQMIVIVEIETELDARITQLKSLDPLNTEKYLDKVQQSYQSQQQIAKSALEAERKSQNANYWFSAVIFFLAAYIIFKGIKKFRL